MSLWRKKRNREREKVLASRRRLEEALEETRWGLEREIGFRLESRWGVLLLVGLAAGFVVGQRLRGPEELPFEDEGRLSTTRGAEGLSRRSGA